MRDHGKQTRAKHDGIHLINNVIGHAPRPHHSDPVSNSFSRQVAAELGSDHPTVAVGAGHLPPDHSGLVGFPAGRHRVPADRRPDVSTLTDANRV